MGELVETMFRRGAEFWFACVLCLFYVNESFDAEQLYDTVLAMSLFNVRPSGIGPFGTKTPQAASCLGHETECSSTRGD